jgi:hypothetical protein
MRGVETQRARLSSGEQSHLEEQVKVEEEGQEEESEGGGVGGR